MPEAHALFLSPADSVTLGLAGILLCLAGAMGWLWWKRSRIAPEERERRRRELLARNGKMGDATLIDIRDGYIFYRYDVRGVEYTATQDIRALTGLLPPDVSLADGHALVKYDPRNPVNSMVLSEEWSGLRAAMPQR